MKEPKQNLALLSENNHKLLRLLELLLVLGVAFATSLFLSIYVILTGYQFEDANNPNYLVISWVSGIISELLAIAVLAYVLLRQGRTLSDIGLTFKRKDLITSVFLFILSLIAASVWEHIIESSYYIITKQSVNISAMNVNILQAQLTLWSVIFMIVNPFFEELIVRAYTMSDIKYLTGNSSLTVILSVLLQTSYHLYQGWLATLTLAAIFLVFSLYYVKRKRVTPIILAHMYFDLWALFSEAKY